MNGKMRLCAPVAALLMFNAGATAQLVVGIQGIENTNVWEVDAQTGVSTPLFGGVSVEALAVDSSNAIWVSDGISLYRYTSGTGLNTIGSFGGMNGLSATSTVFGMAFARDDMDNEVLVVTNASTNAEGFFTVDTTTAIGTAIDLVSNTAWHLLTVAYDPSADLFYGSDHDSGGGAGMFTTPTPSDSDAAFFSSDRSRASAFGDGFYYYAANSGNTFTVFDPNTQSGTLLTTDLNPSFTFSGASYLVPTPASALLLIGAGAFTRRQR